MSGDTFTPDWLALREAADHRSRAHGLAGRVRDAGLAGNWRRVVDLGTGTGSNLRYLSPRLPWARSWTVVDHDPEVLARLETPEGIEVRKLVGDLRGEGLDAARDAHLVTASALLDLVTEAWLEAFAGVCADAPRPPAVLFALSYDGSVTWSDAGDPGDAVVREAVNRHQEGEKGLGQALGPQAAHVAARLLAGVGYEVEVVPSPWILSGVGDAPLALSLMDGWVEAASEVLPDRTDELHAWRARRGAAVREGSVTLTVGHLDLLALPPSEQGLA